MGRVIFSTTDILVSTYKHGLSMDKGIAELLRSKGVPMNGDIVNEVNYHVRIRRGPISGTIKLTWQEKHENNGENRS